LVYLLFQSVQVADVATALQRANLIFLLPAIGLYFAGVMVRTVRWAVLMRPVGRVGIGRLFVVLVAGFMANDILPLRAGEGVRAFMLWRKDRLEPGATLATIVVERIFDGLALTGLLLLAGLVVPLDEQLARIAWVAGVVFAAGILGVFALTVIPAPLLALARLMLKPMPARVRDLGLRLLSTFVDGLSILRSGRDTALVAVFSLIAWLLEASMYFALMFSFPFQPSFVAAMLGTAVANLASMVPSSPGYVGTFDWGLSKVLEGTFQVDASVALAYTGLVHAVLIVPVVALGLIFIWREGLSLRGLTSRSSLDRHSLGKSTDRVKPVSRRSAP
jgi:uncharacterized protein (TIRG00374 family)